MENSSWKQYLTPTAAGKKVRMNRIMYRETGNTLIVPMDHGISEGPIAGLTDMPRMVDYIALGGADAVLLHLGQVIAGLREGPTYSGKDIGLIVHISASTSIGPNVNYKVTITEPMEALQIGADAVSGHFNIGGDPDEPEMLKELGRLVRNSNEYGMPFLAMMYPRGKAVEDLYKAKIGKRKIDKQNRSDLLKRKMWQYDPEFVAHVTRVAAEKGASIIKTPYTGDPDSFKKVVKGAGHVPVVIAGGAKAKTDEEVFEMVRGAMDGGARGGSIGRNIFQHENPVAMTKAIAAIIHENATVAEAERILKETDTLPVIIQKLADKTPLKL